MALKFSGPDVDLLLSNRAELLLALEHITMEMLRMPSEHHSRISFDANDYRLLRIEELRLGDVETPDMALKFSGPDVDLLLSNRAELLLALEHITMEMLRMPSEHHSRISFDANDYRLLRIEELRLSAVTAAEK